MGERRERRERESGGGGGERETHLGDINDELGQHFEDEFESSFNSRALERIAYHQAREQLSK
jgi:hypothetical protein